jgi:hypothetical protein
MSKYQLLQNVNLAARLRTNPSSLLALIALLLGGLAVPYSAQNRPAARVAAERHFTIPPDVPTSVVLMTAPDAACDLHERGANDPAHSMRLEANTEGYVRFHFTPKQDIQDAQLQLDCTSPGAVTTHPLHLRIAASPTQDMPAPEHSVPLPKGTTIRPALTDESARLLSDQEIITQGYPPRPNAAESPEVYAKWLGRVSRPLAVLPPQSTSRSAAHSPQGVGESDNNSHWSGFVATGSYGDYKAVQGTWVIPTVTGDSSNIGQKTYSSVWAGIGGWAPSSTLIQAGTEHDATEMTSGTATNYYAWREVYPVETSAHKAFDVEPGYTLEVVVWGGDSSGNVITSGGYAWFTFYYYGPAGMLYSHTASVDLIPDSVYISGDSAEWVVERPCLECGTSSFHFTELSNYGSVEMDGAYVVLPGPGTNAVPYLKAENLELTMQDSKGNVLSKVATVDGCNTCMRFHWKNFQ